MACQAKHFAERYRENRTARLIARWRLYSTNSPWSVRHETPPAPHRRRVATRCHYPAGGARRRVEASIFKGLGVKSGVPDLLLVKSGKLCALELKSPTGRLSKTQQQTIAQLQQAGVVVAVAHDIDTALDKLQLCGFLRGTTQ
jgi:hypothetical protein